MKASARTQRLLIFTSLGMIVLYGIGLTFLLRFVPLPAPTLDAAAVTDLYTVHNLQFRLGVVLCVATGCFFLPWSLVVGVQMARVERGLPIWSILEVLLGAIGTIFLFGPPLLWGAIAFSPTLDPAVTQFIHQLSWLSFVAPVCAIPMQLFCIGFVSLTTTNPEPVPAFPRWIGYLSLWQGVQAFGGLGAFLFKTGPFAWNGLLGIYLPLALYAVWTAALVVTMLRAIGAQERGGEALA